LTDKRVWSYWFSGNKQLKTLNLDRLAANGVVFTNGYASYGVCVPSRANLIKEDNKITISHTLKQTMNTIISQSL